MKGFEQYGPQGWLESILSIHPEPPKPPTVRTPTLQRYLTKIAVPIVGLAGLLAIQALVGGAHAGTPQLLDSAPLLGAAQFQTIIRNPTSAYVQSLTALDDFEVQSAALLRQVTAGLLTNVPSRTLELAAETVARYADTDKMERPRWVDDVANEVAKLSD